MKLFNVDGWNILYPSHGEEEDFFDILRDTVVLIPKTCPKIDKSYMKNYSIKMYSNQVLTNKFLSTLYHQRYKKFLSRKLYADIYDCEKSQLHNNKLTSVTKVYDDSMIRGSQRWWSKRRNTVHNMFTQYGQCAIAYNIDIKVDNVESIVTSLLCNGTVITSDFVGDVNDEYRVQYASHNHDNTVECNNTCTTEELQHLENISLDSRFIPIFIASVSQKQAAFVQNFIKNKSFPFSSDDFFCRIDFYLNGDAHLSGCLWSFECNIINEELSSASLEGKTLEMNDFLQYAETSILTSVCSSSIKDSLGVTDEEAIRIQNLAQKHQVNLHLPLEQILLPSFLTMYRIKPEEDAESNLSTSKIFLDICKNLLIKLSDEEKLSFSTEDWLDNISERARFNVTEDSKLSIEMDGRTLSFIIDDRLNEKMSQNSCFIALYHYCLSCSHKQYSIVLKRLKIMDCFTYAYNIDILKAFSGKIEFLPIFGINQWYRFEEKYSTPPPNVEDNEISNLLDTHVFVSLTEFFALMDPKKIKDIYSAPVEYISVHEEIKRKYKKVKVPSDISFEYPGLGHFEELSNNILRHAGRLNGRDLLLSETCLHYDVMTQREGAEIYEMYREKLSRIPNGDVVGIAGQPLPTYLLCKNGQILKLRKKMKIMDIPYFHTLSKEYKFARISLYYPIAPGEVIDTDRLGLLFCFMNQHYTLCFMFLDAYYYHTDRSIKDNNGSYLTVIQANERYYPDQNLY